MPIPHAHTHKTDKHYTLLVSTFRIRIMDPKSSLTFILKRYKFAFNEFMNKVCCLLQMVCYAGFEVHPLETQCRLSDGKFENDRTCTA